MAIVLGGTIAVTMLPSPWPVKPVLKVMMVAAVRKSHPHRGDRARRSVREPRAPRGPARPRTSEGGRGPLLRQGHPARHRRLQRGHRPRHHGLETEWEGQRHETGRKIMDQMGVRAAFGMIGTLVGLVQMLQDMSDPTMIGLGMATALLTTLYGAMAANMFFIPLAGKLERVMADNNPVRSLMVEGVVAIQSGGTAAHQGEAQGLRSAHARGRGGLGGGRRSARYASRRSRTGSTARRRGSRPSST